MLFFISLRSDIEHYSSCVTQYVVDAKSSSKKDVLDALNLHCKYPWDIERINSIVPITGSFTRCGNFGHTE